MRSIVNLKFLSLMSTEIIMLFGSIILMIVITFFLVRKELKNDK